MYSSYIVPKGLTLHKFINDFNGSLAANQLTLQLYNYIYI